MSGVRPAGAASALLLLFMSGVARADAAYSYEVENADARPDVVLVVWPRACGAKGEPLGTVDLALNPDWTSRMHDVDYEVVVRGKKHTLLDPCTKSSRLYALPAAEFARGTRASTADDTSIGQVEAGAPFAILPALDALELPKRIELFGKDPRVLRTAFRFEPMKPSRPVTLKAVHEVLAVDAFDGTSFAVKRSRVVYTYMDGRVETVTDAAGVLDAGAPALSASAVALPAVAAEPAAAKSDLGTRWVLLAAVAGLIVGGFLAYRQRRAAPRK